MTTLSRPAGVRSRRGRPPKVSEADISFYRYLASQVAADLAKAGVKPTAPRIRREIEKRYPKASRPIRGGDFVRGTQHDLLAIEDFYSPEHLERMIRTDLVVRAAAGTENRVRPLTAWSGNAIRARLGQLGRKDLAARYDDPAIEELRKRAREPGASPGDFKDEEVDVLWILREYESVPEVIFDPDWFARQSANLETDW